MSEPARNAPVAAINIAELAAAVAGMSRFLTGIARLPAFQESGLGVAEWSALSVLARKSGITGGQLAIQLGVSAQRVNQITDSLKQSKYISFSASEGDARKKLIALTPAGTARLNEVNSKLLPAVTAVLGKRPQSLTRISRMINISLMRIVMRTKKKK